MSGTPAADLAGLVRAGVFGGAARWNSGWFGGTADNGANGDNGDVATRPSRAWRGLRPLNQKLRSWLTWRCPASNPKTSPVNQPVSRQRDRGIGGRTRREPTASGTSSCLRSGPSLFLLNLADLAAAIPRSGLSHRPTREGGLAPTLTRRNRRAVIGSRCSPMPTACRSHLVLFRNGVEVMWSRAEAQEPRPEPVHNYSLISTLRTGFRRHPITLCKTIPDHGGAQDQQHRGRHRRHWRQRQ